MDNLSVIITDVAAEFIKTAISDSETVDPHLYFYVSGGGCSGLQYGLAISEGEPEIDDVVVYEKGIKVVIDHNSAKYLNGAIIGYTAEGMQTGFKIENPNASKSCGCSKSFSVEGEEHDTCGGCGYK
jgi:iron-sulfur cluster assembly protein